MTMRYGSSLNPKWMVDALWRKRRVIFFTISAVSLAGNAVVVAESLGIHETLLNLGSRLLLLLNLRSQLLLQLRDAGELLVQRPVVYMLLNLIMLRMVLKSGILGGHASKQVHEAGSGGRADKPVPIFQNYDDNCEARAHEQAFVSMRRRSSAVFFSYTESALNSNVSFEQVVADKPSNRASRQPKQASLFTIEPLDSHTIEPRSITLLSAAAAQIGSTAQLDIGNPKSIDSAPPNIFTGPSIKDPQNGSSSLSHKNPSPPQNGVSPVSQGNYAPCISDDSGRPNDYDLNKQEFNERVESFITKFKRNLTMQRQDSFNRLLGLVGVGHKR